uniref:Tensin 1 n=1 Tax=Scophthalmus maximus TaxID=52904 RepID=A0A8D3DT00_SCOMX
VEESLSYPFVLEVIHTQGPLDGSLYAKVRKKESVEGTVTANGLPPTAAEHALPAVDHALSVSSDSGNSTASIKTDPTDESPSVHHPTPPAQQPISPQEKQELEQLLSGLEGPMHRQGYLSTPTSAVGGMLHLVPAQVHVNGHSSIDRETDILDDVLPTSQEGNSVDSLGTFSSTDDRATPADLYYQSESLNSQDHVRYLERSVPEKALDTVQPQVGRSDKPVTFTQSDSAPLSRTYMATQNGSLDRSQSFGVEPYSMPPAPARTTSSRDAVQRGLNVWQRFGVPEEPATEGLTFSPLPSAAVMPSHHSLPQFPHGHSASQQEIEQSIETLNILMLDLEPGCSLVPKSQSAPLWENSVVVTTQPSFSQSQIRPAYQGDDAIHTHFSGPMSNLAGNSSNKPEPAPVQGSLSYTLETTGTSPLSQASPTVAGHVHVQLKPINTYPPSTLSNSAEVSEPQRSPSAASASPQPRDIEPNGVFNVEGLVAHRVAGVQARALSPDEHAVPRHRIPSDGQYQNGPDDEPSPDLPVRSPVRCVSPEFVNAIAMNPGGRPKERNMHSYREAFEEMEGGPISSSPTIGRSPPGLAKTPLSALGLKPHNPAEILLNQTGSAPRSYVESVAMSAVAGGEPPTSPRSLISPLGETTSQQRSQSPSTHTLNPPLSSSSPIQSSQGLVKYMVLLSNGVDMGMPGLMPGGSPILGQRLPQGAQNSPVLSRQASLGQGSQRSPVLGRQPSLGQPMQSSPVLSRQPSVTHPQGSPVLGRHLSVSQRSPSLDRHPMHSGYTTPDERHGNLSRQSSSSGYQGPPTPSFPISLAGYLDGGMMGVGFRQCSPAPGFQPQLPEKRRMSSGDRPNGALSYGTLNGKVMSPGSGGSTPGYFHTLSDFSRFNMPDGSPESRLNVKFVQDTSKFWYKPDISREQAISLLREREPGAFVIRDSHSFRGAYGLAMKVASPPPSVHQNKKGDISNELVRHFLIGSSPKGVKLKGCPNEPYFGCLSALVYQHAITPLALPCKLLIPATDLIEEAPAVATANPLVERLKQGAACNVLYINSVEMESLTGPQAIAKAISETLATASPSTATVVHFKVSSQGITLTDNQRKLFFRRHYPSNTVTFCDTDPQDRKWKKPEGGTARLFGFVARKQGSTTDNISHLFAEMDPDQPASAIVNFVLKMIASQKQ